MAACHSSFFSAFNLENHIRVFANAQSVGQSVESSFSVMFVFVMVMVMAMGSSHISKKVQAIISFDWKL